MGRPKKHEHERRSASTRADLTAAEKEFLRDQARKAGMTEAEYVRRRALGQPVSLPAAKVDAALISELTRIGTRLSSGAWNNLNQIARAANSGAAIPLGDSVDTIRAELSDTLSDLRAVLSQVAGDYGS